MFQIIGWLGCFYLLVKALENYAASQGEAHMRIRPLIATFAALGAVGFAIWIGVEVKAAKDAVAGFSAGLDVPTDTSGAMMTTDQANADTEAAMKAVDDALKAADAAAR